MPRLQYGLANVGVRKLLAYFALRCDWYVGPAGGGDRLDDWVFHLGDIEAVLVGLTKTPSENLPGRCPCIGRAIA